MPDPLQDSRDSTHGHEPDPTQSRVESTNHDQPPHHLKATVAELKSRISHLDPGGLTTCEDQQW